MKLLILSDLHLEFEQFEPPSVDTDAVIIAGDVDLGNKGLNWIFNNFPDKLVIYVLGNHEYYKNAYPKLIYKLRQQAEGTNVKVLENESLKVDGIRFFGCTLWTDFRLFGDPRIAGFHATQKMNDYKRIRKSPEYSKLRSIDTAGAHHQSKRWLKAELEKYADDTKVIVTHHAPSKKSLPDIFQSDILSAAYISNLDDFVEQSNAHLWIHGHIHQGADYQIGNTRVINNSRGYPGEPSNFNPEFIIEI